MVFQQFGSDVLLEILANGLETKNEDVREQVGYLVLLLFTYMDTTNSDIEQAICVLANLANGPTHTGAIMSNARILVLLASTLHNARVEIRRPAISCVFELVRTHHRYRELHTAGIVSKLRHIYESTGGGAGPGGGGGGGNVSPTRRYSSSAHLGFENDEVREKVRRALMYIEHGYEPDTVEEV